MSEEFSQTALQKSMKTIGQLYPVLVNEKGEILDGTNRVKDNENAEKKIIKTANRYEDLRVRGNAHYRRRIPQEETRLLVLEMAKEAETQGTKKEEVAKRLFDDLPYSQGYILLLLPQEYKSQEKVLAGSLHGQPNSAHIVEQTVKTYDTAQLTNQNTVECERCHVSTSQPEEWHSHKLCPKCRERADLNPEAYDGFFRYKEKKKNGEVPETIMKTKIVEKPEFVKGRMSPMHSKGEERFVNDLRAEGLDVTTDPEECFFCTEGSMADYVIVKLTGDRIPGYYDDMRVHAKRADKDQVLRDKILRRYKVSPIVTKIETGSDQEHKQKVHEVVEALKF